jgi:hut operon positive regulatory protein
MDIAADRIGKIALLAAMSTDGEEERIKAEIALLENYRLTLTYISGRKSDVETMFVRSLVSAGLKGNVIPETGAAIHALVHAGMEAWHGLTDAVVGSSSLKVKVAIVSDRKWIAIGAFGDSAMHKLTNHERVGFGIMHLG